MNRYINADELKAQVMDDGMVYYPNAVRLCECIDNMPTVDVVPVVHAHWEAMNRDRMGYADRFCCSDCHCVTETPILIQGDPDYNYCPCCGARMYEETE